ncbi:hypothetical protein ABZZ17_34300 [Streptomyces sp. NPDC006512]|uniref:hypothetical protein n=1 Tax=Streptomyces sp. NPDC006512 TaxID=3154307 RepID=UPI0033BB4723
MRLRFAAPEDRHQTVVFEIWGSHCVIAPGDWIEVDLYAARNAHTIMQTETEIILYFEGPTGDEPDRLRIWDSDGNELEDLP